jgi:hypothetical protein
MSAYLLTWNSEPRSRRAQSHGWESYNKDLAEFQRGKTINLTWSCGNRKKIEIGSRVFLLRQGSKFPGLIASGRTTTYPEQGERFRDSKKRPWYVDVDVDFLLPLQKALKRKMLLDGDILPKRLVNSRASGRSIDANLSVKLEKAWKKCTKHTEPLMRLARIVSTAREGETVEQKIYIRKRDRRLRDQVLESSREVCEACGTDFSKKLDGKALRVLQIHHKKQLGWSDGKQKLTKATDLAVVCANCHLLIHIDPKKAMSIEKLKGWLKKSW